MTGTRGEPRGATAFGSLVLAVVLARVVIFYRGSAQLPTAILLLAANGVVFALWPVLSPRLRWLPWLYVPLQSAVVVAFTNLRPYLDASTLVYLPLLLRVQRAFSPRVAIGWTGLLAALVIATLILGLGWAGGLAFAMMLLGACAFLVSYERTSAQRQADQAESEQLLAELQRAHRVLQDQAARVEELAAARERNRLARELHDSVSQAIFGITLTSQATRLLLEREPARVPEQLDRLEEMSSGALAHLRSLIAQLRPPQTA